VFSPGVAKAIALKVGYAAVCLGSVVTIVVAGYAHKVVGYAASIGKGIPIDGSPSTGAMNILVMGLRAGPTTRARNWTTTCRSCCTPAVTAARTLTR